LFEEEEECDGDVGECMHCARSEDGGLRHGDSGAGVISEGEEGSGGCISELFLLMGRMGVVLLKVDGFGDSF
jgi:hypothetical protein